VNGWWLRAAGAEEIVRPRRLIERFWAALNFAVGQRLGRSLPALGPFARAFVALNRVFGGLALFGALCLLAKCSWHLLRGERSWSQDYFAVLFGAVMVLLGIVYLNAPLWRRPGESADDGASQEHQRSAIVKAP